MKRFILGLAIVTVVVVALAGATYVVVKNALDRANTLVRGGPNTPPPFSYAQLEKMMDATDAPADSEIPKLIACFDENDENLRFAASETLARIGAPAVEPLRAKLKDKDAKVRYYCVQTLGRLGRTATPAADDLLACLKDADVDVRCKSAYVLGQLGMHTDPVIEGLANALDDPDNDVRRTAADSLEKIGPPALPRMYQLVTTAKNPIRGRLMEELEKIGTPPADVLPMLAKLAKDPDELVRHPAFMLLAQIGKPAVPTFKEALNKPSPSDLFKLPHAIVLLPSDDAKELLPELEIFLVKYSPWDAETELMGTLKKCGRDGAQTLTNLLKTLQDPTFKDFLDSGPRTKIVLRTLGEMGADAKIAVPTLVELLKDRSALRPQILDALGDIGPAAREKAALPAEMLLAKEGKTDPVLAEKARTALVRMGVFQKKAENAPKDK